MLQLGGHLRATTDREGGIVLDLVRGQLFRSNASGALIVELLSRGCERMEIERALGDRFGLSPEEASADAETFLSTLRDNGFLLEPGKEG